jgi:hypothetical protein
MSVCWDKNLKPHGVAINLLVCRIERDINREAATKTLLKMIDPKIRRVANRMVDLLQTYSHTSRRDFILEIQSVIIESLLTNYHMGETLHPLRWLFGKPNGAVTCWFRNYVRRIYRRTELERHYTDIEQRAPNRLDDFSEFSDLETYIRVANFNSSGWAVKTLPDSIIVPAPEYDEGHEFKSKVEDAIDCVEDGLTFPINEYRVMRFCLSNAQPDAAQPMTGLHLWLSRAMRMDRKVVGRLYGAASRRLLDVTGATDSYLQSRGLRVPRTARARRARRVVTASSRNLFTPLLSADEVADLIELSEARKASVPDLAWMYGVSEDFVYRIRRRFRDCTRAQIHKICSISDSKAHRKRRRVRKATS